MGGGGGPSINIFCHSYKYLLAPEVTGLTTMGSKLFLNEKSVHTVDMEGLRMFSSWLLGFQKEVILLGHNIEAFDIKHLSRHITDNQLAEKVVMIAGLYVKLRKCQMPIHLIELCTSMQIKSYILNFS